MLFSCHGDVLQMLARLLCLEMHSDKLRQFFSPLLHKCLATCTLMEYIRMPKLSSSFCDIVCLKRISLVWH